MEITSLLAQFVLDENNRPRKLDGSKAELRNRYLKIQGMVREARNDKGDGVDFTAHGHTKAPHRFSSRFNSMGAKVTALKYSLLQSVAGA